jgi:hypothetical protein
VGWDCRDMGDHPFCSHGCCRTSSACRTDEVRAALGFYKDVVARDPTPPRGFWARFCWIRPTEVEAQARVEVARAQLWWERTGREQPPTRPERPPAPSVDGPPSPGLGRVRP